MSAARPELSRCIVTDDNGFVLQARPNGWSAIFGFYTPTLRTTALIPGQVRLLRSLLDGREATVERVILASETDGTYVPRARARSRRSPAARALPIDAALAPTRRRPGRRSRAPRVGMPLGAAVG